ncbi:MAG: ABC transporter permease [Clostridia bacterium]|nr:ABC transporter permease [Clostridia bacterium]
MRKSHLNVAPFGLWMVLFTIVPLGMVVWFAFTDEAGHFTLQNLGEIGNYLPSFWYSIWVGALSTFFCLLLAYPLAYSISRSGARVQRTMVMIVMLPMWMNSLLRITALKSIIDDNGLLNRFLELIGLEPVKLVGTTAAIVLGMVYDFLPFMILPLYSVMTKIDSRTIEAAQDLGSNGLQVLCRVILPLSVPGILSGITMVFVPSVSTFVVATLLGNGGVTTPLMIGEIIEFLFKGSAPAYYNMGAALSLVLMLLILLCIAVMNMVDKGDDEIGGMMP